MTDNPPQHTLWISGTLRCVMVTADQPRTYTVHVFNRNRSVYSARVDSPDEAAALAERMWDRFVEGS